MDNGPNSEEGTSPLATESASGDLPPHGVLEIEAVYEALGHPRRRYLCYTLFEDAEWSLTELASKVAAWEDGVPESEVSDERQSEVYVSLYHAHAPKLVDEGVITFDESTETIAAADHAEQVLTALEQIGDTLDSDQESHAREGMKSGE
jgi:hypothetical protein